MITDYNNNLIDDDTLYLSDTDGADIIGAYYQDALLDGENLDIDLDYLVPCNIKNVVSYINSLAGGKRVVNVNSKLELIAKQLIHDFGDEWFVVKWDSDECRFYTVEDNIHDWWDDNSVDSLTTILSNYLKGRIDFRRFNSND